MKYLLDTDHISFLQRPLSPECRTLRGRMALHPDPDFTFSIVSYHEQFLGVQSYLNRARDHASLVKGYTMLLLHYVGYSSAQVLPFDAPAGDALERLESQRIRVGAMDLRIASIALSRKLILLTRNVSDFSQVPGLTTEDRTA